MKVALRGGICNSAAEVQVKIAAWIDSKPEKFFADGINKLLHRWQQCINHEGNYFEHLSELDK